MAKSNYDYNTFKKLFDDHIHYAYEPQYGVTKTTNYIIFYKLTLYPSGKGNYKQQWFTFNPKIWKQIEAFADLLKETQAEKLLYGQK